MIILELFAGSRSVGKVADSLGYKCLSIDKFISGDAERKGTCLWLKNLPCLVPTNMVKPEIIFHKSGRTDSKLHFETLSLPKEERRKQRSKTFDGFANAMANQWGNL